jgi:2-polyprenyl-6-methoxyphenol hydroxylase-like FAD-dependent oxidoreductase
LAERERSDILANSASADVVIVGGGVAGSALAFVLARRGIGVIVLERQAEYADRVRGEYMQPWGVVEAQRLEILDLFLQAGGVFTPRQIPYDENIPPEIAEKAIRDHSADIPGVPGPLCVGHPSLCRTLSSAAESAGAHYYRGATQVEATMGSRPTVSFECSGSRSVVGCRLIVGADGRTSAVRSQIGFTLNRAEPTHLISGMLVDGVPDWPRDTYAIGTEGDREFLIFPQSDRRLRLYTCTALDQRDRYAGIAGPGRFLEDFRRLTCVPAAEAVASGIPIGPCATVGAEDTWVDLPIAEGVVLVGDAAGYNDPIIGQGLALSLRDVRIVSELLLAEHDWSPEKLLPYAEERRERMRRVRFGAALTAALFTTFGPDGAARRARVLRRLREPGSRTGAGLVGLSAGPEATPAWAVTDQFREEFLQ